MSLSGALFFVKFILPSRPRVSGGALPARHCLAKLGTVLVQVFLARHRLANIGTVLVRVLLS